MWVPNEDGTYTAEQDDTLWGLSDEVYSDGSRWEEFKRMDGDAVAPEKLQPGMIYASPDTGRGTEREVIPLLPSQDSSSQGGSFSSVAKAWAQKPAGATLSDSEANLQMAIGGTEMIVGPTIGIGLCESSAGQSVLLGLYIMADGGNLVGAAATNKKAIPLEMLGDLLLPTPSPGNNAVEYLVPFGGYR